MCNISAELGWRLSSSLPIKKVVGEESYGTEQRRAKLLEK